MCTQYPVSSYGFFSLLFLFPWYLTIVWFNQCLNKTELCAHPEIFEHDRNGCRSNDQKWKIFLFKWKTHYLICYSYLSFLLSPSSQRIHKTIRFIYFILFYFIKRKSFYFWLIENGYRPGACDRFCVFLGQSTKKAIITYLNCGDY